MITIQTYPLGPIQTNCYVLIDDATKKAIVVDPGDEGDKIVQLIKDLNVEVEAILLTHAHFDHIGAVDAVRDAFDVPVYIHEIEKEWLGNPALNGSGKYAQLPDVINREADYHLTDETELTIGPFHFKLYHTPGHSPGSVTYHLKNHDVAFVGDVIFRQSIGRTDLVGGSMETLLKSIHDHILTMDETTILYPGHGPVTTPEMEQDDNPFLNGF